MTTEKWMAAIEEEYRKTPFIIKRMAERPGVLIYHHHYNGAVTTTSSLNLKYVELISLDLFEKNGNRLFFHS